MGRGGAAGKRHDTPERRCIATGRVRPRAELVRFVVGPGDQVVPDLAARLPGRGIWVSATRAALELAAKRNLFARAVRRPVTLPDDLPDLIEALLARRVIDMVSLARKSGQAVAGFEKVRDLAQRGEMALLVQASDGSPRGKTKLRAADAAQGQIDILQASELGFAFGRDRVIHAALRAGGLTERVVEEAARLAGVRGQIGENGAGEDTTNA